MIGGRLAAWELGVGSCPVTVYDHDLAREVWISLNVSPHTALHHDRLRGGDRYG